MEDNLKKKIKIAEKAAGLYPDNPEFTMKQLAGTMKIKPADLYGMFPGRKALLRFYYTAQFHKYKETASQIEGFNEYTLAEKLGNLAYTLTDLMLEHREFVELTYDQLIGQFYTKTDFEKLLEEEIKSFHVNDTRISTTASILIRPWYFRLIRQHYLWLISYWLKDESPGFENTMGLTDKWTVFLQEMLYSSIVDKGFDLAKFVFMQSAIKDWFETGNKKHKTSASDQP
jgi:hypothetical protein